MILHGYWRSGAAYRVRIGMALKGLGYEQAAHDLRAGEQSSEAYRALNPQGLVPALEVEGAVITQSVAILEWLEETHPSPPLLPEQPAERARVRSMVGLIASDIHPLNNLRVTTGLRGEHGWSQDQIDAWAGRWIGDGLNALQALVARDGGDWCFADAPTMADCMLIPQLYSARRFNVDTSRWTRLAAIEARAEAHPAFQAAHPDRQPDAD